MKTLSNIKCSVCGRKFNINTLDNSLLHDDIIRSNYVCHKCKDKVKCQKINITCNNCEKSFTTKLLVSTIENIDFSKWLCPACNNKQIIRNVDNVTEFNCYSCKSSYGVCYKSDLNCLRSLEFVPFECSNMFSDSKQQCSVFAVDSVDVNRNDFHTFRFVLLYKNSYLISKKNVIIIKSKIGSRHKSKILLVIYKCVNAKFIEIFREEFARGNDWIIKAKTIVNQNISNNNA